MCKPLPGQGLKINREREDNFLADEMLLCSRDHMIAVIYALPEVCTVLYGAIKQ